MQKDVVPKEVLDWANNKYRQHAQNDTTSEKESLNLVKEYFESKNLGIEKIKEDRSETPDFIFKGKSKNNLIIEVKSPLMIKDPETGMYVYKRTLPRLRRHIKKAYKQFFAFDKKHKNIWVLVFTSTHFQQNWHTLAQCLQGYVGNPNNLVKDLRKHEAITDTNDNIKQIDAFLWLQINKDDLRIYEDTLFVNTSISTNILDILVSNQIVYYE